MNDEWEQHEDQTSNLKFVDGKLQQMYLVYQVSRYTGASSSVTEIWKEVEGQQPPKESK